MQSVLHNLQKVTREIGIPIEEHTPDVEAGDPAGNPPMTMRVLLETVAGKAFEANSTIGKLETAVVELASILNAKINPHEEDRDAGVPIILVDR